MTITGKLSNFAILHYSSAPNVLTREQIANLGEILAIGSITAIGFLIGGSMGTSVLGGIGIKLASNIVHSGILKLKQQWLTSGVLNHDIQYALVRAYVKSLRRLEERYFNLGQARSLPSDEQESIHSLFAELIQRADEIFLVSLEKAATEVEIKGYLYDQPSVASDGLWSRIGAGALLQTYNEQFRDFLCKNLLNELQFQFAEELKADNKHSNKAWRAFQRLLLEGIQNSLATLEADQAIIRTDLQKLDSISQQLEHLKDIAGRLPSGEPFEEALEKAISETWAPLQNLTGITERIDRTSQNSLKTSELNLEVSQQIAQGVTSIKRLLDSEKGTDSLQIPDEISAAVLTRCRRRCVLCYGLDHDSNEKVGRIVTMDGQCENLSADDLCFLCLIHCDRYPSGTRLSKAITPGEVRFYRDELYRFLEDQRKLTLRTKLHTAKVGPDKAVVSNYSSVASTIPFLPPPGIMVIPSPHVNPTILRGLSIPPDNPFLIDFLVEADSKVVDKADLQLGTCLKLIKYFVTSIVMPESEIWVNLSPDGGESVTTPEFGLTEMGEDLLRQDYLLKQLLASLTYPEDPLGQQFWNKIYADSRDQYGTAEMPVNTFNKVWILPERAEVFQRNNAVVLSNCRLRAMMDQDYKAMGQNIGNPLLGLDQVSESDAARISKLSSNAGRELLLPVIEEEVNQGKNFGMLRQVYHSHLLGNWYKQALSKSPFGHAFSDSFELSDPLLGDPTFPERVRSQYLSAYEQGVFNYIREDIDESTGREIPRRYMSGGIISIGARALARNAPTNTDLLRVNLLRNSHRLYWIRTRLLDAVELKQLQKDAHDGQTSFANQPGGIDLNLSKWLDAIVDRDKLGLSFDPRLLEELTSRVAVLSLQIIEVLPALDILERLGLTSDLTT